MQAPSACPSCLSIVSESPAAVAAFLRGLERRARLFATVQAGSPAAAGQALAVVAQVFAGEAAKWPIAQWPRHYWRLLLAAPALRKPAEAGASPLPGIARLPAEARAAVLLYLVAELDEADVAAVLGVSVEDCQRRIRDALPRDALGQPDADVWRAWRAAAQRERERLPAPAPVAARSVAAPPPADDARRHRRRLRWLWVGVIACVLALAATFFLHPRGRALLDAWRVTIKHEALPPADPPKARFDAADAALHPDRELLAAPEEFAFARDLPLLAWLAQAEDASALPEVEAASPSIAPAPPMQMRDWDALSPSQRGTYRGAWAAWQALPAEERALLRSIARRLQALPAEQQQRLRADFDALPFDARHGWWLGPVIGREWPRVAALFAFVPDAQRPSLLRLLREAPPEDIDQLQRLAQTTPPEARDALRLDLLQVPTAQRHAWLLAKLQ
ncbi:MAG: DUF3106 domain-containing protein [Thermomonas sp.]|uniref:DUF3106 domain-containing protein n=1 Tax=Thermomonas sp. TaxID=1971895 RepID=UPI0039E3B91A